MSERTTFKGDEVYNVDCSGDVCAGDEVAFERAEFTGNFRNAKFAGYKLIKATIERESYGADKQQHTFTLLSDDGTTTRIKGRNLYANGIWRKPWPDETARSAVMAEKHARGERARAARACRKAHGYL